jgi:hypothetical protein
MSTGRADITIPRKLPASRASVSSISSNTSGLIIRSAKITGRHISHIASATTPPIAAATHRRRAATASHPASQA